MAQAFSACSSCNGLSPASRGACIHCDAPLPRSRWRRVVQFLAGGGFMMTLAACYGVAYRPGPHGAAMDSDRDGSPVPADCDDNDASRWPGNADPDRDGIDSNCDGVDGWRDEAVIAADPAEPIVPAEPAHVAVPGQ